MVIFMKEKIENNKLLFMILGIVFLTVLVVSGTYAVIVFGANVADGEYDFETDCFDVDFSSTNISGVLWPRISPSNGLHNSITMKISDSCNVFGTGKLDINVDNSTSSKYFETVAPHCENANTLETFDLYTSSSDCTSHGGIWVTNGTALKYSIYDNSTATGNPLDSGYINSYGFLYSDEFDLNDHTPRNLYLFIWLDGWLVDNDYADLSFLATLNAEAKQYEY